jgi:hypothetical protein
MTENAKESPADRLAIGVPFFSDADHGDSAGKFHA